MSGGSFDYLCWETGSTIGLKREQLERMARRLHELGWSDRAVSDTAAVRGHLIDIDRLCDRLTDVWKAVEWFDSCDWSVEQARKIIAPYPGDPQPSGWPAPNPFVLPVPWCAWGRLACGPATYQIALRDGPVRVCRPCYETDLADQRRRT